MDATSIIFNEVKSYSFVLNIYQAEAYLDTLQDLWVRAVFMTLVNIALFYQKMINIL